MPSLAEPWLAFLSDLDQQLTHPLSLACMGGFVMTACYGLARSTQDIDSCGLDPLSDHRLLDDLAGMGSPLHAKHNVYIQHVGIVTVPCDHQDRLIQMPSSNFTYLTLFALEAHDLALSKLERNSPRDRLDVQHLATQGLINARTLEQRYFEEQRPYLLGDLTTYDRRLDSWLEACWPQP